jgi:tetratricopeptide (TPR) repeat protein
MPAARNYARKDLMFHLPRPHSIAIAASLLLSLAPLADSQAAETDWVEVSGEGVAVYLPAQPDQSAAARSLVQAVEGRRRLLENLLDKSLRPVTPVAIYLFPDGTTGEAFGATTDGPRRVRLPHVANLNAAGPLEPQRQTLVRGAVESMVDDHLGALPQLWRAGIVQFLLESEISASAARPVPSAELLAELRKEDWLPLVQYAEADLSGESPFVKRQLAGQIWALIFRDVVVEPARKPRFQAFIRRVLDGEKVTAAFPGVYLSQMDAFQGEVRDAVRSTGAKGFANAAAMYPIDLSEVTVKPLAGADRDAAFGHLLVDLQRAAPAEARCTAALQAQPEHPRAVACVARLMEQRGELDNARQLYAKALAAAPNDRLIAYFSNQAGKAAAAAAAAAQAAQAAAAPTATPEEASKLEQANEAMQKKDYPAALALLEEARKEATDPAFGASLDTKIGELRHFIAQNNFAKGYGAAAEHYNASRWNEAISALEALLPTLTEAEHKKKTADLLAKAKANKENVEQAAMHNQFVAAYNKASELYNQKKLKECAALLDKQLAMNITAEDKKVAQKFLELCRPAGG